MLQKLFGWMDDEYDKIPVERAILSDPELPGTVLRLAEESLRTFGRGFLRRKYLDHHYAIMPGIPGKSGRVDGH